MPRLPKPGSDKGTWGGILNEFLEEAHNADGTLRPSALPIASSETRGVVQLAGDLAGTAAAPTVPALASKYVKPPSGIPEADLSSGVQTKLNAAETGTDADVAGYVADAGSETSTALSDSYGPAYNLFRAGLTAATNGDLKPFFDTAFDAGARHVVIPRRATPWNMSSLLSVPADTWIEFEPSAKINLTMTTKAIEFGPRCILSNGYFTSPYSGPSSAADNFDTDAAPQTYVYDARGIVLEDDCLVLNHYQENCAAGLEFQGERIHVRKARFKNIRQYQGWGAALHAGGNSGGSSPMRHCLIEDFKVVDSDRGCEVEAGASYNTFTKGHLKNVGASGYTGQPAGTGPNGDVYATYTFVADVHSHTGEGACRGNVYRDIVIEDCYGGITAVRSDGSNDSDLPCDNVWENITISGRAGTTGYESVYVQGHGNRVDVRLRLGSGVNSLHRVFVGNGNASRINIEEASAYALPLVTGFSTAEDAKVRVRRVGTAPSAGAGYLLDIDSPTTEIDAVIEGVVGATSYLRLDDSSHGSSTSKFRYEVPTSSTMAQVILLAGSNDVQLDGIYGLNNESGVKDIVTTGGVARGYARGSISRSSVAVSVDLGGASSLFDTTRLDMSLGTISDAGTNSRSAREEFVSSFADPVYAAAVAKTSTTTPIAWGVINEGRWVRKRVNRRSSLTRFRFKVVTQSGNYYAAVCNAAGVVLWKTTTSVPAAGVVSQTMTGVEIKPGEEIILVMALSSATAAVCGVDVTGADQNLFAGVRGTPKSGKVANLYTTNTAVGATIVLGSTHSDFIPLITLIET